MQKWLCRITREYLAPPNSRKFLSQVWLSFRKYFFSILSIETEHKTFKVNNSLLSKTLAANYAKQLWKCWSLLLGNNTTFVCFKTLQFSIESFNEFLVSSNLKPYQIVFLGLYQKLIIRLDREKVNTRNYLKLFFIPEECNRITIYFHNNMKT